MVKVSADTTKVGDTLTATITPSDATVTYQWLRNGLTITGATSATFNVTEDYIATKLSVTVTDANGNKATSEETNPVTNDKSAEITLVDKTGLQSDGTALPDDLLAVSYGQDLGTPSTVIWWCDGAAVGVYTTEGGKLTEAFTSDDLQTNVYLGELPAGDWWVTIENTEGLTSVTNVITVADHSRAIISDVSFEDDYETAAAAKVDLDEETTNIIVNATFNKDYAGKLYVVSAEETTFTTAKLTNTKNLTNGISGTGGWYNVKKAVNLTNEEASTRGGIYYIDSEGAVHCKFPVALTGGKKVTRGEDYMLIFDQKDIKGDEISTTAESSDIDDLNISEAATVPYVEAPAEIAITAYNKAVPDEAQITFYNESGDVMAWWDDATDEVNAGVLTGAVYEVDSNKIDSGDTPRTIQTLTFEDGKAAAVFVGVADKTYAYAKIKTTAGIFAKEATELTSEVVESAPEAASKVELKEASTAADATVNFTGLHKMADGTVYILQGDTGKDTEALILAQGIDKAIASAKVAGGSTSVSVTNVFKSKFIDYDNSMTNNNDKFVALFVPDDESIYSRVSSEIFELKSVPTSLEFVSALVAGPADGDPDDADDLITFNSASTQIAVKNQFGKTITANGKTVTDKAVSSLAAKNAGGAYGESFGNATYSITSAGALSVKIERNTKIDRADGLTFEILGSKFELTAPFGVGGHDLAACYNAKLGDNTLWTAAIPTAGLTVIADTQALVDALGGASDGDKVVLGAALATTKAITVKAGTTLELGATLTLGAGGNKIYGTLDTSGAKLDAGGLTIKAYDGATIIGNSTAANMANITKLSVDVKATKNGVTLTDADNAGASLVLFALDSTNGTAATTATAITANTATVNDHATIAITADGTNMLYAVTNPV